MIALGADRDYDTMWIGWVSDRDRGRQRLVAALPARADLSRPPGRAVTLADLPSLDPDDHAERRAALARRTGSSNAQVNWRALCPRRRASERGRLRHRTGPRRYVHHRHGPAAARGLSAVS